MEVVEYEPMSSKRARSSTPASRARAISAKIAARFPLKEYGRMHVKRGSESSLAGFGPSFREANADQKQRRKHYGYYGRGKYSMGQIGKFMKPIARVAGRAALNYALPGAGDMLMGRGLYTGRGAYKNSLMTDAPASVISSAADETGAVTVSRTEFLTELYGPSGAFEVLSFPLNPGIEASFPWLSQIAQNYEEYEMKQLIFSFRSTTTEVGNSTNGQVGTVIMATQYDPSAAPFSDKKIMMAYDGAMSCRITDNMHHGVECDPKKLSGTQGKYVRAFGVDQSKDIKDYDHGKLQIAIANAPSAYANYSIGEVWVSYTIELRKPKFFSARGLNISRDIWVSNGSESSTLIMGPTTNLLRALCNNIGTSVTTSSGKVRITFPADYAGHIAVCCRAEGSFTAGTSSWANNSPTTSGNVVTVSDMYGSASTNDDTPAASAGANSGGSSVYEAHFSITPATGGVNNYIELNTGNITSVTQASIEIKEINLGFSYRYANISTSDAPILVNASGVVVVP